MAYGVGGGAEFKNIKIRINPDEGQHAYLPHVHIMRTGHIEPEYRISLIDCQQLNDKKSWKKEFTRKERKLII
jgi:hypothetical protein